MRYFRCNELTIAIDSPRSELCGNLCLWTLESTWSGVLTDAQDQQVSSISLSLIEAHV